MNDVRADRAKAQLRAGMYARLSETYDAIVLDIDWLTRNLLN